jgi:hypothetical protein
MKLIQILQMIDPDRLIDFWDPEGKDKEVQNIIVAKPGDILYKIDPKWFDFPATVEQDLRSRRIIVKVIL